MKKITLLTSFLLIAFWGFSQVNDFTPKETIYVGPNRTIKSLADYFTEDRNNVHVLVDEGSYTSNSATNIRGENIIVEGVGEVYLYCSVLYDNVMWVMSSNNIIIRNFHMKHLNPGEPESQNCSGRVIGFDISKNITVENCDLNGCGLAGLHDNGGNSDIFVTNCWIHNNSLGAYTNIDGDVWQEETDDHPVFKFSNNKMENNGEDRVPED